MNRTQSLVTLALAVVVVLGAGPARSSTSLYEATLEPQWVVPPSGASAYGNCSFVVDTDLTELHWNLIFAGLDSPQTGAVFLRAAENEPGVVLHTLPLGSPLTGVWVLDDDARAALAAGELAIQVSDELFPDGAIRGNFEEVMTPTEATSWGEVKSLLR